MYIIDVYNKKEIKTKKPLLLSALNAVRITFRFCFGDAAKTPWVAMIGHVRNCCLSPIARRVRLRKILRSSPLDPYLQRLVFCESKICLDRSFQSLTP